MHKWLLLIAALAVVLVLAVVVTALGRLALNMLNDFQGERGAPDPMFAEPVEIVTRPPEPTGEPLVDSKDDPSAQWVYDELSPVEKTAAELADEHE